MEALSRLVLAEPSDDSFGPTSTIDTYLLHLRAQQFDYLASVADAGPMLEGLSGQVGNLAALHARLTQQFFDAQRLILKRRADAHATVIRIATDAEDTVDALIREARTSVASEIDGGDAMESGPTASAGRVEQAGPADPYGIWADTDGVARAIDRAFERDVDDAAAAQALRTLLDEWWRAENQEDQAAIDDANARAAMRVHIAEIEAREIAARPATPSCPMVESAPLVSAAPLADAAMAVEPEAAAPAAGSVKIMRAPVHTVVSGGVKLDTDPMLAALEAADHEGLDSVLASLLDTLDDTLEERSDSAPTEDRTVIVEPLDLEDTVLDEVELIPATSDELRIRCDIADVDMVDGGRQEAFDSFWDAFRVSRANGRRDWVLVQVMLPAVAVVAVLALVLAWVG